MNNLRLEELIREYKKDFNDIIPNEIYKWKAVKCFQDNWNIDSEDFPTMLKLSLSKTKNLLLSRNHFPRDMVNNYADSFPEEVHMLFKNLYDESQDLVMRIESFRKGIEAVHAKWDSEGNKNHYQTYNVISTYLWLRFPDKYYIYKPSIAQGMFERLVGKVKLRSIGAEAVVKTYKLYDEISDILVKDAELREMLEKSMTADCYQDLDMKTATVDLAYYVNNYMNRMSSNTQESQEEVKTWMYAPGEGARKWDECLENSEMYLGWDDMNDLSQYSSREDMVNRMKEIYGANKSYMNDSLATWEFAQVMNVGDIVFAKKGLHNIIGRGVVTGSYDYDDEREEYKHIRSVKWEKVGDWYIDEQIVMKTLTDITKYKDYVKRLNELVETPMDETEEHSQRNYWWLNANPKVWSMSEWVVGEIQDYTLFNDNGNKRRIYQNFIDAKEGDIVVCYESNPTKQILGLAEVAKANDGEKIMFRKTETLSSPIDFSTIKEIAELRNMEFLVNPNGSFFKLTCAEYEIIIDLIRESNKLPDVVPLEKYSKSDFLNEVFMDEKDYDRLSHQLKVKKNVILQGAPGVGKTFSAKRLAYSVMGVKDDSRICFIQFHQNYSYEDFIMGYRPVEDKFILRKGIFYDFCTLAKNNRDKDYFFIIDEINRGNLSKIFGELLMLIEKDYRGEKNKMTLAYTGEKFYVPENLYIIGMMNTADRSLAMIDYALRRRFSFFNIKPGFETEGFKKKCSLVTNPKLEKLVRKIIELNKKIIEDDSLGSGFEIGHSYLCFKNPVDVTDDFLRGVVEYDIIPMLEEYWFDNKNKVNEWSEKLKSALND